MISRYNDIANELREIIPDAQWTTLTPAPGEVPAGYFEQLPEMILQKVHAADAQEELATLSPLLAEVPKSFPLSVPSDYFSQLSQQLLQHVSHEATAAELPSVLADMPKTFPMSAPAAYFDQLPAQLLQKVRAADVQEELEALSPLLAAAPKTVPLSVPAGYFDQLDTSVMAGISEHTSPTTAPVIRRMTTSRYIKWAVAACLIALASTSTLFFIREHRSSYNTMDNALATVTDQEIMEYLQSHTDAFDKEELASYAPIMDESNEIPAEVDELPAEAIQHYLDNTGLLKESLTDN